MNPDTLKRLKAKIIAGAANNQLSTPDMGIACREQGILYAPDFVINAGGIIKVCYEYMNTPEDGMDAHVRRIADTLTEVFQRADADNLPTSVVADQVAEARFRK